jgi:predicted DNA-binding transcriptional regulator AlpA
MVLDLVSIVEVAEMLGVSRQRAHQIMRSYADFPKPEAELAVGRIWQRQPIASWIESHPRSSGRPRSVRDTQTATRLQPGTENCHPPSGGVAVARGGRKPRAADKDATVTERKTKPSD